MRSALKFGMTSAGFAIQVGIKHPSRVLGPGCVPLKPAHEGLAGPAEQSYPLIFMRNLWSSYAEIVATGDHGGSHLSKASASMHQDQAVDPADDNERDLLPNSPARAEAQKPIPVLALDYAVLPQRGFAARGSRYLQRTIPHAGVSEKKNIAPHARTGNERSKAVVIPIKGVVDAGLPIAAGHFDIGCAQTDSDAAGAEEQSFENHAGARVASATVPAMVESFPAGDMVRQSPPPNMQPDSSDELATSPALDCKAEPLARPELQTLQEPLLRETQSPSPVSGQLENKGRYPGGLDLEVKQAPSSFDVRANSAGKDRAHETARSPQVEAIQPEHDRVSSRRPISKAQADVASSATEWSESSHSRANTSVGVIAVAGNREAPIEMDHSFHPDALPIHAPSVHSVHGPGAARTDGHTTLPEPFTVIDSAESRSAANAFKWVHAGGRSAEAGFQDPVIGWVSVRAQAGAGGVHASVVPSSMSAAEALTAHLPALNAHLAAQHPQWNPVTLSSTETESGSGGGGFMQQQPGHDASDGGREGARDNRAYNPQLESVRNAPMESDAGRFRGMDGFVYSSGPGSDVTHISVMV